MKFGVKLNAMCVENKYLEQAFQKFVLSDCFKQCQKDNHYRLVFIYSADSLFDIYTFAEITTKFNEFIGKPHAARFVAQGVDDKRLKTYEIIFFLITEDDKDFGLYDEPMSKEDVERIFNKYKQILIEGRSNNCFAN